jgi:MFS family permease
VADLLPSIRGLPRTYWYLWAGALLNRIGGFVAPFFAIYLTESLRLPVAKAGTIIGLYGLGGFAASPIGGFLADRYGRKPTLLLSLIGGPAALVLLSLARTPATIAPAALLYGLLGELYRPVNQALIADVVPSEERQRAFGILYWAVNLGFSLAAVIAGLMARRNFALLFWGDAATTLVFAAIVYWRIPETRPAVTHRPSLLRPRELLAPLADASFLGFILLTLFTSLVFQQCMVTLPVDMRAHGISTETYGFLMAINGVLIVLLQPTAIALVPRWRRSRVMAASALLVAIGFSANAIAQRASLYAVAIAIWTLGEIGQAPVGPSIVADLSPANRRGSYQGLYLMAWGASSVCAPILGSRVLGRWGSSVLWYGCGLLACGCALGHLALAGRRGRRLAELRGGGLPALAD